MIQIVSYSSNINAPVTIKFNLKWIESADMTKEFGSWPDSQVQIRESHVRYPGEFIRPVTLVPDLRANKVMVSKEPSHLVNLIGVKIPGESQGEENIPRKLHDQL
jgi:hypothetical protein